MASGTFTGSRAVNQYGPWLTLHWTEVEQQISNNRTKVRLTLRFHWDRNIAYVFHGRTGKLHGSSYSYSGTARGTSGSLVLRQQDFWINHNSDGTKSQSFSGNINTLGLNWSGTNVNNMSVSGTATLTPIPRKSDLTSASIGSLQVGTANTLSIGRSVKYTGFYHLLSIYDGSTWIWDTGYFRGSPSTSYTIPASTVNKMLQRMGSVNSKTFRVRLQTYTGSSGSGRIGESAKNISAAVHSSVTPSASGISVSIAGDKRDKEINKYVQSISKVTSSFTSSAGYGASVSSRNIVVRRVSGAADSQTISGAGGTTSREVRNSGQYEAIGTITDSRGRKATSRIVFNVEAYNQPRITSFTGVRNPDDQSLVDISRVGNWSHLGGDNPLEIIIQRKQGDSFWSEAVPEATASTGSFSGTVQSTDNNIAKSYDFRLIVKDSFGNSTESLFSIGTAKVLFDKHKDLGIGIGKLHERGELDVAGEAYFDGDLYVNDVNMSSMQRLENIVPKGTAEDTIEFWQSLPQGTYFVYERQIPNQPTNYGVMVHSIQYIGSSSDWNTMWYAQHTGNIYRKSGNENNNHDWWAITPESSTNSNGTFIKLANGTMICTGYGYTKPPWYTGASGSFNGRYAYGVATFPATFKSVQGITGSLDGGAYRGPFLIQVQAETNSQMKFSVGITGAGESDYKVNYIAIGRWK